MLRSNTTTSESGRAFFNSSETVETCRTAPDDRDLHLECVVQPVELIEVGDRREEHQLVAAGLGVTTHELRHRLWGREHPVDDLLDERAGERVVVAHVGAPALDLVLVAQREVALGPQRGAAGAAEVGPCRVRPLHHPGEQPRGSSADDVAVGVASHPQEGDVACAADEEPRAELRRGEPSHVLSLPERAQVEELLGEPVSPSRMRDAGGLVIVEACPDRRRPT